MRQVPTNPPQLRPAASASSFYPLFLGRGRLLHHFHHYFHQMEYPHKHYEGSLRGSLDDSNSNSELDRKLKEVNAIWILVSDQAIEEVFIKIKNRIQALRLDPNDYSFIHSSASLSISGMKTIHPLMSFSHSLYALEIYESIPLITFRDETPEVNFSEFFSKFKNPHFELQNSQRELYHATAVLMSNLPVLLWSETSRLAEQKLGFTRNVFLPILDQTLKNFQTLGPEALTGPIARQDEKTIEKNLQSLTGSPLKNIYEAFLKLKKESP